MLSCRKSNANVCNNNLETQDFRTASRVQPTFSRRFEKSTRPTDCAVPAPGVMNGAPTGYAANQPTPNNIQPPRKRTGATCDARMTDAKPQTGRHKTTFNHPQT
ncbi:unknown [Prevotella sp. CAG:755]|nr:unknown [Prevotella sp. CAG:755]